MHHYYTALVGYLFHHCFLECTLLYQIEGGYKWLGMCLPDRRARQISLGKLTELYLDIHHHPYLPHISDHLQEKN